jgi:hypothetical protein
MRRGLRASLAVPLLAVLLAAAPAAADDVPPTTCQLAPGEKPIESRPMSLFPRRNFEFWAFARVLLDWNGGNAHGAWGPGAELAFTDDAQRFRLGTWFVWPMMGRYGDGEHKWLSFEGGLSFRGTVLREELFDVYLAAQGSLTATWNPDDARVRGAGRFGPGLGIRFARHIEIEALWQPTFAFSDPFVEGETKAYATGLAIQVGLDTCAFGSWCEPSERKPRSEDLTCQLYAKAHETCETTTDAELPQLCAAIATSLDAEELEEARSPADPADSTELFLRAVVEKLPPASPLRARIEGLRTTHGALTAQWHASHDEARAWRAEEPPRRSPIDCRYSAYATELRGFLGCAPGPVASPSAPAPRCPAPACVGR